MAKRCCSGGARPKTPGRAGWLRASHRKLDLEHSLPYRPWHTHDESSAQPGEPVELDIEIWPTCIVVPAGYRIAPQHPRPRLRARRAAASLSNMKNPMKGCGPFTHDDETDRPPRIFGGR